MQIKPVKKILFLTGTRADFGKLKSLMRGIENADAFELMVFITGMHMLSKYGSTYIEVDKENLSSTYKYINQNQYDSMDIILSKTISGLSDYIKENRPDMIVVHGDRVETLAGAIVGALNNILTAHIEGGEVSGTIDELIRHSVSKLSHIHFVCNDEAKKRLLQLGESERAVHVIGSPDLDIMSSPGLPDIHAVKQRYNIAFENYCILLFHPVTTETDTLYDTVTAIICGLKEHNKNVIVIYPNNDSGSDIIFSAYKKQIQNHPQFKFYPSIRFEYFLTLLKHCDFIIGNSSAGIREAPYYGIPTIDIGSRQKNRSTSKSIIKPKLEDISACIATINSIEIEPVREFGDGMATHKFLNIIGSSHVWETPTQKHFNEVL